MMTRRHALAGLALLPAAGARAQPPAFPDKPLTMIIPFPPGGPADIFGRYLAKGMAERLGKPVVAENKDNISVVAALNLVAKAGLDAHVMGIISASTGAIMPSVLADTPYDPIVPYDPIHDLAPIILIARVQEILVVTAKLGIADLEALIARLKAAPGKLSYASAGIGSITHLAMELFERETGTRALHVPYRGAAPATQDLIAGNVQMAILDLPAVLPHVRSGALKAIAVTSDRRAALLPDVPTMRELGYPRVNSDNWYGLVSPGASIRANRDRLHAAAAEALKSRALIEAYAAVGGIAAGGTAEEFARFQRRETEKWSQLIRVANIKFD
ncbi:tripartite tricarboxylate transporter substrate-binding protein [Enhydrobacter sp.]|jgi:tripartite-type tricarboxylate transporter receptor subunit TctC|uniref:Bug family tripartite tricarboxylate transporter substrate binding protein n=1 Tax=Enhydrobacter sp. TaxID=1894999 RepID=UPI0026253AD2|nr:tripartite tricarboxylate transporter substrate-binding protein [Enhydrobacter sp.]WIM11831.1 MAG: BUG/TctC family periplasmic protein [Enhydrobacter sp.]